MMANNRKAVDMINDRVIEMIKQDGILPWQKPWVNGVGGAARNAVSNREYQGINVWLLMATEYTDPRWCTYKQATEKGGKVIKGEHGTPIVFWKILEGKEKDKRGNPVKIPFLRYFKVFNVEQTEGIDWPELEKVQGDGATPIKCCDNVVKNWKGKPKVKVAGKQAMYIAAKDEVHMPPAKLFKKKEERYSTLFHELGHATGHESRLNRTFGKQFGDKEYAREELVAELTAAYLSGYCGIQDKTIENSAAYLKNWMKRIEEDPNLLVWAGSRATKAYDLILGRNQKVAKAE